MRRPLAVIALALLAAGACGKDEPALSVMGDRESVNVAFVVEADALCKRMLPPLRPDLKDTTKLSGDALADIIVDKAASLEKVVDALRHVERTDKTTGPAVAAWFRDWDAYLAGGRSYARALRSGDDLRASRIAADADAVQRRISRRARDSDMAACALDGVPLPERESPI